MKFYTNVQVHGGKILYRGIENGRPVLRRLDYNPVVYLPSKEKTEYTTIHGEYLAPLSPGSLRETRDFINKYKDVGGFNIYGNHRFEYNYIADEFPTEISWDISSLRIANIDIEVGSENGFPEPDTATEPVTAITIRVGGRYVVFGCQPFFHCLTDVDYIKCDDELDLLKRFLDFWSAKCPDVVTGWNIKFFDIPYLINRITRLFGEATAKRISPWLSYYQREVDFGPGRKAKNVYTILGIAILDYIDMYQRYAPEGKSQDSYKLDNIASVELGEKKLSYDDYDNLHRLYRENFQLFIEYNIRDVELIEKLDDKLKLLELVLTLAYDSKTNFEDAFTQVRMWDILIYNYLRQRNIIVPPNETHSKEEKYKGGFVKPPIIGLHKWVASFDLNSLYPHLIMQYGVSPDTFLEPEDYPDELRRFIAANPINVETLLNEQVKFGDILTKYKLTVTPNCQFFRMDKRGFLSEMMETMYNDRSVYKDKAKQAKKELEEVNKMLEKRGLPTK